MVCKNMRDEREEAEGVHRAASVRHVKDGAEQQQQQHA